MKAGDRVRILPHDDPRDVPGTPCPCGTVGLVGVVDPLPAGTGHVFAMVDGDLINYRKKWLEVVAAEEVTR